MFAMEVSLGVRASVGYNKKKEKEMKTSLANIKERESWPEVFFFLFFLIYRQALTHISFKKNKRKLSWAPVKEKKRIRGPGLSLSL